MNIFAVHINHGLREASDAEEKFVGDLCDELKVPLAVYHAKPDFRPGESMEMWARRIRQNAFDSGRREFDCDFILTAHHANDNLETILMHLDDSCGIGGLRGIPKQNGVIIRPLLRFSRNDIRGYVRDHGLRYMEDESNADVGIKRNYVRHKVVQPWSEQAKDLVARFTELSQEAAIAVDRMNTVISKLADQVEAREDQKIIHDDLVKSLSINQMVRLVKCIIGQTGISWRRHRWEELSRWLNFPQIGSKLNLNDQWTILRDRDSWILTNETTQPVDLSIEKAGRYNAHGFNLSLKNIEAPQVDKNPQREVIDASVIKWKRLNLRSWRNGDTFQPLGMAGHKKVSDLLVDGKVDRFTKEKQLVLTADDEIIWVCGRRLSERAKVTNSTTEFLELYLEQGVGQQWA